MVGSMRFELTSGSPEGSAFAATYPNGQRGNYSAANLDRSGSFREGIESRGLSSGNGSSRGSTALSLDMPPLSQCLMLEPIMIGGQKYSSSVELRRALGVSSGGTSVDHPFGAAHSKPHHPVATDELKRFKANVLDASIKARDRAKTLCESILKLEKYCEALSSKKRQRSELLSSDRSGGANLLKMGSQIHRNSPDLLPQRLEDKTKNVVLNKRARTSVVEVRAEGRTAALSRQPVVMEKDRDIIRAGGGGSIQVEEKTQRLPAGGEGWDQKMKRKRSVGTVVTRAMDGDREIKRTMHQKLGSDPRSRSCEAHGFRSGPSDGIGGINKLDTCQPASSNARTIPRNELENVSLLRDRAAGLDKERVVAKGNHKCFLTHSETLLSRLQIREDNQVGCQSSVTKGKASRAPRTGSVVMANSSPTIPRTSGTLEGWDQRPSLNKVQSVGGVNNRKRPMPTGSSSPPVTQWVGQRPQKISRTRRTNLVSPVSNHDEAQISSEGFSASDFGARLSSDGTNGPLLARGVANKTEQFKMKPENVSSPARLSESEESGAGESKLKEKGIDSGEVEGRPGNGVHKVGSFIMPTKKNKILIKEDIGDGVRRQGRSGRGSSLSRAGIPPLREKLENPTSTKPLRSTRPGSDKNESKLGRPPSKKLSERKAFTRPGHVLNSGSSDVTGESYDDHEELLAAANSARHASNLACSGSFWKKMEPLFASVSSEDTSYLKQQVVYICFQAFFWLSFSEALDGSLCQMFGTDSNVLGALVHEEVSLSQPLVYSERQGSKPNRSELNESVTTVGLVDQFQDVNNICGRLDTESGFDEVTPLYQRVLSALIGEDETEEFDHDIERSNLSFWQASDDPPSGTCIPIDIDMERMGSESESKVDLRSQKHCMLDRVSCHGSTDNPLYNADLWEGDDGLLHSEVGVVSGFSQNNLDGTRPVHLNVSDVSSFDCQYQQMCLNDKLLLELRSIGIYPDTVIAKKKGLLGKIDKAIQKEREVEERELERVAMDKLIEMAYKKPMACRGSYASKSGVSKVSKSAALAFINQTLDRCRKFEDSGRSCFSEPALRDVIFSAPPYRNDTKPVDFVGSGPATNMDAETQNYQPEPKTSVTGAFSSMVGRHDRQSDKLERGSSDTFQALTCSSDQAFPKPEPISNRGKKREVLLDDVVGSAASRATSALGNSFLGGAKGKRSERDMLTRNPVAKAGRPSLGSFRGERKTKSKPKQKTAQLSTSGNGLLGRITETTHPVYPPVRGSRDSLTNCNNKASGEVGSLSPGNIPQDSSKETKESIDFTSLRLHELDSIEELGVSSDLGGPQDLSSWLNFDEDGLQDHDSMGLEIPMDDLSELNMLI
ncbi:hypothetical protein HHK36_016821 [Tetracentron sinense]|uniref:Uncharacterized protein n=1 Tax=Tetracentron sinense TaxID=13715 RepID=A0A834Z5Z9_TETSI|nr:hypothetical protein HHK36_016821 [Tetracentron sinense]